MELVDDKGSLLSNINYTRDVIQKRLDLVGEYNGYHKKPIYWTAKRHVIVFFVTLALGLMGFVELSNLGVFFLIGFPFIAFGINRYFVFKKVKNNSDRIKEIDTLYEDFYHELHSNSIIPTDYWNIYAMNAFEKFLLNHRADSLKECINLWENDLKHQEKMYELQAIQMQQEHMNKEIQDTKLISIIGLLRK